MTPSLPFLVIVDSPNNRESAIIRTLTPAPYTAIVRGSGRTTGVGRVEVHNIP